MTETHTELVERLHNERHQAINNLIETLRRDLKQAQVREVVLCDALENLCFAIDVSQGLGDALDVARAAYRNKS